MQWKILIALAVGFGIVIEGTSENDVIFTNKTGLPIARIVIGDRTLQGDSGTTVNGRILVAVSPHKHHLLVVFRGGADVSWSHLNFRGIHEIIFERHGAKIDARIE